MDSTWTHDDHRTLTLSLSRKRARVKQKTRLVLHGLKNSMAHSTACPETCSKGERARPRGISSFGSLFAHNFFHQAGDFGGLIHYFFRQRFQLITMNQLGVESLFFGFRDQLGAAESSGVTCAQDLHDVWWSTRRAEHRRAAELA